MLADSDRRASASLIRPMSCSLIASLRPVQGFQVLRDLEALKVARICSYICFLRVLRSKSPGAPVQTIVPYSFSRGKSLPLQSGGPHVSDLR